MEPREQISSNDIRAILDAIPGLAWSVTSDGLSEFFNQEWQQYTGFPMAPAEHAQGWGWGTVIHPDDRDRLERQWQLCLA